MVSNFEEALILYSTCEAERRELEFALQFAQAELQRAEQKFQHARNGLTKAEFRAGRIRVLIKRRGFAKILQQARVPRSRRMLYFFLLI
jgi:hypothetical protein